MPHLKAQTLNSEKVAKCCFNFYLIFLQQQDVSFKRAAKGGIMKTVFKSHKYSKK